MPATTATPLVSLIVPAHGRWELLRLTLASVFAQTLVDWEAVIVDDAATDDSAAWLAEAAARDPRVRVLRRTGPRGGANVARNQGRAASRGRYVVFLDSDDLLEPDCLRRRAQRLDAHPELDFTVHAMRCFRVRPNDTDLAWNALTDEDDFERYLLMDGPWQTAGATWRQSALDRVGPWDPDVLSLQDLEFHVRAIGAGLTYAKVNAWDCHYRLPFDRPSITSVNVTRAHFRSHVAIARRLLQLPRAVRAATPRRRDLLGGFCFLIAYRCAGKGDLRAAVRLWSLALRRGVVGPSRFAQGLLMLLSQKRPATAPQVKRLLYDRWPEALRSVHRRTFLNAPLPPRAGADDDDAIQPFRCAA